MNWLLFFNSLFPLGLPCSVLLVSSTAVTLDNEICVPWILDLLDLLLPSGLRWKSCYQACWTSNFTPLPCNDPFKYAPCSNPYICIPIPCSYPFFLCVPCRSPFICTTSPVVILFYVSLFPYYYFHWIHIAHVTILLLLISVLYTAHSLMTTNACWLYSMHATCFTAFSLYATCILHFLCIQCLTMHPCWFIHLQPHVMVCTLKIFWERAHVLTRRDTLLSKDVYILCSGAVPVGWLEDPEGYLARRSPD